MDDARLWGSEEGLWTADPEQYREIIDDECLMVLPDAPYVFNGAEAVAAVSRTPRWSEVAFSAQHVARPQEGLIVIAYAVTARRGEQAYSANCTTTYRRLEHEVWRVIQHHQSPTG